MISFSSGNTPMRSTIDRGVGIVEIRDAELGRAMYKALLFAKNEGELDAVFIEGQYGNVTISIKGTPVTIEVRKP